MRRYLAALIEQAFWSLLNLGVNVALARFATPESYGGFTFWASCGFVLTSLQNALTVCHLQVLPPGDAKSAHRTAVERLMHLVTAIFLIVVAAITITATVLSPATSELRAPAAGLFVPAYLLQQYIRSLAFSRGKAMTAAVQTGTVFVLVMVLLGTAVWSGVKLRTDTILLLMGTAYGVVGVGGALLASGRQMLAGGPWPGLLTYGKFAAQSGWVFLGVTTTELLARFYTFVVAASYGPGPLGILAATQLLLRPVPLLAASWSMVGRSDLAAQREAAQWGKFSRTIAVALMIGVVISLVVTLVVRFSWPVISHRVFAGKYADVGWMVLIWGVSSGLSFAQIVLGAALQVLKAFKVLALANAAASFVAAGAILLIIHGFGYPGAVVGTAIGQALEVVVTAVLLVMALRTVQPVK